jgi:hypothetical protein
LVERGIHKPKVPGSSPGAAIFLNQQIATRGEWSANSPAGKSSQNFPLRVQNFPRAVKVGYFSVVVGHWPLASIVGGFGRDWVGGVGWFPKLTVNRLRLKRRESLVGMDRQDTYATMSHSRSELRKKLENQPKQA